METWCPGVSTEEAASCGGTTVMWWSVLSRQVSFKASWLWALLTKIVMLLSCACVSRWGANRSWTHCCWAHCWATTNGTWRTQRCSRNNSGTHWSSFNPSCLCSTTTVLTLWEVWAKKNPYTNFWRFEGRSWGDTLAGVPTSETKEYQLAIRTHLWRSSHCQLLGTDRWTLHVSAIITTSDLKNS